MRGKDGHPRTAAFGERMAYGMDKTKVKLNICGVEVAVAGDVEPNAAQQIAEAVRARMEKILLAPYTASVEKAAVITAMNLCEELARRESALQESEKRVRELTAELTLLGGADGLRARLAQAEMKLKVAQEQLRRTNTEPEAAELPSEAEPPKRLKNPVRAQAEDQMGFVSFFAKDKPGEGGSV